MLVARVASDADADADADADHNRFDPLLRAGGRRLPSTSATGTTVGAPSPSGNPACGGTCENGCPAKWFSVVGTGATITASTCNFATSGSYNSRLVVFSGACSSLTCVGT